MLFPQTCIDMKEYLTADECVEYMIPRMHEMFEKKRKREEENARKERELSQTSGSDSLQEEIENFH